jgi:geranylgeranyl diphosphate synthase type II
MRLSRRLTLELDEAEKRIERLVEAADGRITTEPIDLEAEGQEPPPATRRPRRGSLAAAFPAERRSGRAALLSAAAATSAPRATGVRGPESVTERLREFERYFRTVLPPATELPRRLHAAMRYSALSPGKRVRPLLVLTACEAVGGGWRRALPAAAAVECVHAFSLVHDDLPSMDDDDYRRGRLTTHKKFGDAVALLAGDALLALAFEELTRLLRAGVPAARVIEAQRVLARAAGSRELVGGQVLDLEAENSKANGTMVRDIHVRKTGAVISAALVLGGIAGGATTARMRMLERLGQDLGLAFQIHDDLMNLASSLERLGKRSGTDAKRGKATYPRAVGVERARGEAARLYLKALERVERLGPRAMNLGLLVIAVAERER